MKLSKIIAKVKRDLNVGPQLDFLRALVRLHGMSDSMKTPQLQIDDYAKDTRKCSSFVFSRTSKRNDVE